MVPYDIFSWAMIYVMFETKNEIDLSVMIEQSNSGVELKNEACIV
jgi:hypothetical protein